MKSACKRSRDFGNTLEAVIVPYFQLPPDNAIRAALHHLKIRRRRIPEIDAEHGARPIFIRQKTCVQTPHETGFRRSGNVGYA
jgi:hypothetical protein